MFCAQELMPSESVVNFTMRSLTCRAFCLAALALKKSVLFAHVSFLLSIDTFWVVSSASSLRLLSSSFCSLSCFFTLAYRISASCTCATAVSNQFRISLKGTSIATILTFTIWSYSLKRSFAQLDLLRAEAKPATSHKERVDCVQDDFYVFNSFILFSRSILIAMASHKDHKLSRLHQMNFN